MTREEYLEREIRKYYSVEKNALHYENILLNFHDIKFLISLVFLAVKTAKSSEMCVWRVGETLEEEKKGWAEKEKIHSELIIYDSRVSLRCFFTSHTTRMLRNIFLCFSFERNLKVMEEDKFGIFFAKFNGI